MFICLLYFAFVKKGREIYKACDIQTIDVSATVSSSSYYFCNLNLQTLVQETARPNCNIAKVVDTVI